MFHLLNSFTALPPKKGIFNTLVYDPHFLLFKNKYLQTKSRQELVKK